VRRGAGWRIAGNALAVLLGVAAVPPAASVAFETDQFSVWTRPLVDATAIVNAKFNLEIARALRDVDGAGRPHPTCDAVARAVRRRLKWELFQPIELWAVQSPLVDQDPARGEQAHTFIARSIYRHHGLFDFGMWMPLSPTIDIGGIRLGTDKLAHMVSSGWKYRDAYLRRIRRGETHEQAIDGAIHWGIFEERSINGSLGSGVFSRADLEADYQGMLFYLSLCEGADPILVDEGGRWRFRRPFDLRDYVGPEWDESYDISTYTRSRWRKVKPEIAALCPFLAEPSVWERFERYRAIDRYTPTERLINQLVAEGKLPDFRPYTLEVVCPRASRLSPPAGESRPPPADVAEQPSPALTAKLAAIERDRVPRTFVPWSVGYFYPRSFSGSVGLLFTEVEATNDCRSLCDLRGPTVQVALGPTGAQVSAGWGRLITEATAGRRILANVYLAYGLRGTIVRTWGDSPLAPRVQTLTGVEGALSIARVSFTFGVLRPVGGTGGDRRWVFSGGLGYGF
jgi:hypothetical protein